MELEWMNALFVHASDAARTSIPLKASGERYAAASMRAALDLHDALKINSNRKSFDSAILQLLQDPASAMPAFVRALPFLLDAERFSTPNGMFDFPHLMATAYFLTRIDETPELTYKLLIRIFSVLLIRVQTGFLTKSIEKNQELFIAGLADVAVWRMPERIAQRYAETGRDLLPSPAAVIVALGGDPIGAMADGAAAFYKFVNFLNAATWQRSAKLWPDGHENTQIETVVKYLLHMRLFLSDSPERLELAVLACDRVPVVSPWYILTILAARAYAMGVYVALNPTVTADAAGFTTFSLIAMVMGDPAGKIPNPTRTLFNAGTKSNYLKSEGQSGEYWCLLRSTLSGMSMKEASTVAEKLVSINDASPNVCAATVMLCAMMRTQASMIIFSYRRPKSDPSKLSSYPLASKVAMLVDVVKGQTVFDFVMTTISGTLDLEMLSSDDIAGNNPLRAVAAWRGGASAADALGKDFSRMEVVGAWIKAMQAIGNEWVEQLTQFSEKDFVGDVSTQAIRSVTRDECRDSLERAFASHASINHGQWLAIVFRLACDFEGRLSAFRPPLITSHLDVKADNSRALGADVTCDNAWLRLNLRHQAEQVLHSARRGGMLVPGNNLVLVAWLATPRAVHGDAGVRIFARALSEHTVKSSQAQARLVSTKWRNTTQARGDDSVVATALEFERALQSYCTLEHREEWPLREGIRKKAMSVLENGDFGEPLAAILPMVPKSSKETQIAAAIASGPAKLDGERVLALDESSDTALFRFRKASTNAALANQLFVCQTTFEHGVSVGIISSPATTADDLRPVYSERMQIQRWKTAEEQRASLLERLRRFQKGAKDGDDEDDKSKGVLV